MKSFILSFLVLFALASGLPSEQVQVVDGLAKEPLDRRAERFIDGIIVNILEGIRHTILDHELDPLHVDLVEIDIADYNSQGWPVGGVAELADVTSSGLASFVINRMSFSLLTLRLQFDLSIPVLSFGIGSGSLIGHVADFDINVDGSGSVAVHNARVWGQGRVGIFGGISVNGLQVNFNLDRTDSNIASLNFNGEDFSADANELLGEIIPHFVHNNQALVSEWLTNIAREIVDYIL